MSDAKCPVVGCGRKKADWHLTCAPCWRRVPKQTQAKIYRLYRDQPGGDDHRLACFTALDILNAGVPEGSVWP